MPYYVLEDLVRQEDSLPKAMLFQWHMPLNVIHSILSTNDLSMPEIYLILSYLIKSNKTTTKQN